LIANAITVIGVAILLAGAHSYGDDADDAKKAARTLAVGYIRSLSFVALVEKDGTARKLDLRDELGNPNRETIDTRSTLNVTVDVSNDMLRALVGAEMPGLCVTVDSPGPSRDRKSILPDQGAGRTLIASVPPQQTAFDLTVSVASVPCDRLDGAVGVVTETAKVHLDTKDFTAIAAALQRIAAIELFTLVEVKHDNLGGAGAIGEPLQDFDVRTLGTVTIDRSSDLAVVKADLTAEAAAILQTAQVATICATVKKGDSAFPAQTIPVADMHEPDVTKRGSISVVKKQHDAYDITVEIVGGSCGAAAAPPPKDSVSTQGRLLQQKAVHIDTEDFGFRLPPIVADSITFGRTRLSNIERPAALDRRSQIGRLGVNIFFFDKFRHRGRGMSRFWQFVGRTFGVNITAGLKVAGPSVATSTQATSVGGVAAIPYLDRSLFIGYGHMITGPELKNRGFWFVGVSGTQTVDLIKKLF
jgi:hypothetical protein